MPPDHAHKRPNGPKERELAVALTVAALRAVTLSEPLEVVGQKTIALYDLMLAAVTKRTGSEHDKRE